MDITTLCSTRLTKSINAQTLTTCLDLALIFIFFLFFAELHLKWSSKWDLLFDVTFFLSWYARHGGSRHTDLQELRKNYPRTGLIGNAAFVRWWGVGVFPILDTFRGPRSNPLHFLVTSPSISLNGSRKTIKKVSCEAATAPKILGSEKRQHAIIGETNVFP